MQSKSPLTNPYTTLLLAFIAGAACGDRVIDSLADSAVDTADATEADPGAARAILYITHKDGVTGIAEQNGGAETNRRLWSRCAVAGERSDQDTPPTRFIRTDPACCPDGFSVAGIDTLVVEDNQMADFTKNHRLICVED